MARSANISAPEVIQQFRAQLVQFGNVAQNEVEGVRGDVTGMLNWLDGEQTTHWRTQLRKREEAVQVAQSNYTFAKYGTGATKKASAEEERIILKRAVRRKEEAEAKLKMIKSWSLSVNQQVMRELKPVEVLASEIVTLIPKALQRLDQMMDNLDIYLRTSGPGAGSKGTSSDSSSGDA